MSFSSYCAKPEFRRHFGGIVFVLLSCCAWPSHAQAWRAEIPHASENGNGELRWFGFQIYRSVLWGASAPFDPNQTFALALSYARHISGARLVQTSIDEMRRLSGARYSEQQYARWQVVLEHSLRDVDAGDQLIGVFLPGIGCRFYSRTQLLAEVSDLDFAQAFFRIWLDPRSKDAQLHKYLTGEQ